MFNNRMVLAFAVLAVVALMVGCPAQTQEDIERGFENVERGMEQVAEESERAFGEREQSLKETTEELERLGGETDRTDKQSDEGASGDEPKPKP